MVKSTRLKIIFWTSIIGFIFLCCKSYDPIMVHHSINAIEDETQKTDTTSVDTFNILCNGKEILLTRKGLVRMRSEWYACIEEKAFYGDEKYERILGFFLKDFGCNHRRMMNNSRFRGEIIFNALLEIEPKYIRGYDFDGEATNCTDACICTSNLMSMIESVHGQKPSKYFSSRAYKPPYNHFSSGHTDEEIIKIDKLFLRLIKQAWEKGEIVLKPYGEE